MSDRMDKQSMEKYYNYMKNYYPPGSYPMRTPYFLPQEKQRKGTEPYSMYGYPPYPPYQMPPMGYPQPYPEPDHKKHQEDKPGHEMPNPYHYYPYSPYPYYSPYAYPPFYYGQRDFSGKNMPHPPPHAPMPGQLHYPSLYPHHQTLPQVNLTKSFMKQDVHVKQQIVISSDSEQAALLQKVASNAPPHPPPNSQQKYSMPPITKPPKPQVLQQQKTPQKKGPSMASMQQADLQPFLIQKNKKIVKQPRTNKPKPYQRIPVNTRYNGMPTQAYQEMIKKQTRLRLELFYQRERERRQQEKNKQAQREAKQEKVEDKKSSQDKSEKQKKPFFIPRISAPVTFPQDKDSKKERIKDDHPLKELRYNQSHGRIRLGAYFQSNIPTLLPQQDLAIRRVELQKKLRERQISAITF